MHMLRKEGAPIVSWNRSFHRGADAMVDVIGRSASIPYVEARVGISIKICCFFFGTGVKRFYAVFFLGQIKYITDMKELESHLNNIYS
jgi:hypothetical protein